MEIEYKLLEALQAYLSGGTVSWTEEISQAQWLSLLHLARVQRILPMFYHAVRTCPSWLNAPALDKATRSEVLSNVMVQTTKTVDFLSLYRKLLNADLQPLVVKGIVCSTLYPHPDYRLSGDEDLVIPPTQSVTCHDIFLEHGMRPVRQGQDSTNQEEAGYQKPETWLYTEVHQTLFPSDAQAYGELNQFFSHAFSHAMVEEIQGTPVWTLDHTHHLLFLILHAFKHFIHSGFGIRQVCDIILYANAHGSEIDWGVVLDCCQSAHAHLFAAALFQLGEKYLTFDRKKACIPPSWQRIHTDCQPILADILSGGIYGASSASRQHSATITLHAVAASKTGKSSKLSVFSSLFPSYKYMAGQYSYLKKHPYLLPVAWISRMAKYRRETSHAGSGGATQALHIGNQRVELLRQYGIIP